MKDKMPDRIDVQSPKIIQGVSMLGNWTANQSTHNQTEYIRADLLEWKDTRKGELPGTDDFPLLVKDDFDSAFGYAARIEVVTATHKFGEERWHGLYTSHSHGNYPFWRPIVEVEV